MDTLDSSLFRAESRNSRVTEAPVKADILLKQDPTSLRYSYKYVGVVNGQLGILTQKKEATLK